MPRKDNIDEPRLPLPPWGKGVPVWRILAVIVTALAIYGIYAGGQNIIEMLQDASSTAKISADSPAKVMVTVSPPDNTALYYTMAFPASDDPSGRVKVWYIVDKPGEDNNRTSASYTLPNARITREAVASALNEANYAGMVDRSRKYAAPFGFDFSVAVQTNTIPSDWYPLYVSPWGHAGSAHTRSATRALLRSLLEIIGNDPVINKNELPVLNRLAAQLD
jgi:hypothetical protein